MSTMTFFPVSISSMRHFMNTIFVMWKVLPTLHNCWEVCAGAACVDDVSVDKTRRINWDACWNCSKKKKKSSHLCCSFFLRQYQLILMLLTTLLVSSLFDVFSAVSVGTAQKNIAIYEREARLQNYSAITAWRLHGWLSTCNFSVPNTCRKGTVIVIYENYLQMKIFMQKTSELAMLNGYVVICNNIILQCCFFPER